MKTTSIICYQCYEVHVAFAYRRLYRAEHVPGSRYVECVYADEWLDRDFAFPEHLGQRLASFNAHTVLIIDFYHSRYWKMRERDKVRTPHILDTCRYRRTCPPPGACLRNNYRYAFLTILAHSIILGQFPCPDVCVVEIPS